MTTNETELRAAGDGASVTWRMYLVAYLLGVAIGGGILLLQLVLR